MRFRLVHSGVDNGWFRTTLPGEHNVRNALAALAAVHAVGVRPEEARGALAAFSGVRRRLELRGEVAGVRVFDDFAHHPTAVRETLTAMRAQAATVPGEASGRLVAVFEPRSFTSRTSRFERAFSEAFALADRVFVAGAHLKSKVPVGEQLSEDALVAGVNAAGGSAEFIREVPEIVRRIVEVVRPGDRVVVLSNGGFGGIHSRLLDALAEQSRG
jgi:UDP-N-acetylmuramate: L-alanyl-gamma-D-glutamyl-meso-diaminopimelate ligase